MVDRDEFVAHDEGRTEDRKLYQQIMDDPSLDDEQKEARILEEIGEPFSITKWIEIDILLSWGGPADGYRLYIDSETREVVSGVYYFMPWFGYEERRLSSEELDTVAEMYQVDAYL
ncbi:hypothetical protein SE17_12725 [Kouleothrix aurantiaca]|uniref:Uncharacterized protein n=1 Tax=Kouleothrix aurantiaca TaxID=186479 RepID=A0A0P9DAY6_9CHLR|nr:hypothetical protein SE17_12725 [Kouleothrix aurantiaca]